MAESKYVRVVKRLHDKTKSGDLDWKEAAGWNGFQVSFPDYSIVIYESASDSDPFITDYIISIVNSDGSILDKFSDVDLRQEAESTGSPIDAYEVMKDLYHNARRQALGVEKALDSILKDLEARQH